MSNTLLIHIGMPKTGTSTLQKFLFINRKKLEEYGWSYPILSDDEIGIQEYAGIESCGNGYHIFKDWVSSDIKSKWDKGMESAIKRLKYENVIISSEHSYSDADKFIADAKKKYENVKVIVYLRRQDRAIESLYNQLIKNGDEYNVFKKFIISNAVPENFLEYTLKLDQISQIIGKENLIIRIYEKQQLIGNDIVTDFLSIIRIPLNWNDWNRIEPVNPALKGNYLEINRLINSIQNVGNLFDDIWDDGNIGHNLRSVCARLSRVFNEDKIEQGFFSVDERKEFLRKFASGNERIAREYLSREDGILFYDDRLDYPLYETSQYSSFETDMIRVFVIMMYVQNRKFGIALEKKTKEMIGKIIMKDVLQKKGCRKVLLFGAGHNCQKFFDIVGNEFVALIVDNDETKNCTVLNRVPIKNAMDITNWQDYFIIVTCAKTDEIEGQLRSLGLKEEEDYILMKDYGI